MASWFRSKEMEYISILLHEDAAHNSLRELGNMGCVQFLDLNPDLTPFQRRYVNFIRRCDELERKIMFFIHEIKKDGIPFSEMPSVEQFLAMDPTGSSMTSGAALLDQLEELLSGHEKDVRDNNTSISSLSSQYRERVEHQQVLLKARDFFLGEEATLQSLESEEEKKGEGMTKDLHTVRE